MADRLVHLPPSTFTHAPIASKEVVGSIYCYDKERVLRYFREHPIAPFAVHQAIEHIRSYCPYNRLVLEIVEAPGAHEQMLIRIQSSGMAEDINSCDVDAMADWVYTELESTMASLIVTTE